MKISEIQQQCSQVAKNPSKINQLNQILIQVLSEQHSHQRNEGLTFVVNLIQKLILNFGKTNKEIFYFLSQKLQLIFSELTLVLTEFFEEGDEGQQACSLLKKCYQLSSDKFKLANFFLQKTIKNSSKIESNSQDILYSRIDSFELASDLSASLIKQISILDQTQLERAVIFILELPHLSSFISTNQKYNIEHQECKKRLGKNYQELVLTVLARKDLPKQLAVKLYRNFGDKVLSKFATPLVLSQYFLGKFKTDPQVQVEVLSCLFILVGKYGLQLEQFYPKLLELIQIRDKGRSVYELPNSKRFFKLVESALRSSRVPLQTVIGFVRIILAQTFTEQSEFVYWALSFLVNLTKKHRKILDFLSTFPELELLKKHYSAKVRALAAQLNANLNKAEYLDIQQFAKIDCKKMAKQKMNEVVEKLQADEGAQFKVINIYEPI